MATTTTTTTTAESTASDTWDRPVRPSHLRGQILSLHAVLIAVMVLFAFFATDLSPSAHLIVLATITVTLGCKHSNFFYCLLGIAARVGQIQLQLLQPRTRRRRSMLDHGGGVSKVCVRDILPVDKRILRER